jgi:arylsulfatase A-like enzyme
MNLPEDVPTIAELISEDYLCGYLGKWHLGDDVIAQHGFDHWISTEGFCQNSALTMKPSRPKYRIHPCI